jgi:uncharacterized protein
MPLLTSPIDGSPMKQIQRFGIEIDVCPTTGGVWLDKGELEKLMNLIREAAEEERQSYASRDQDRERGRDRRDDRDDERYTPRRDYPETPYREQYDPRYHKGDKYYGKPYKQKSTLSKVMDIFDF